MQNKILNFIISWVFPESREVADFHAMSPEEVYQAIPRIQSDEARTSDTRGAGSASGGGLIDRDIRAVWQYDHPLTKVMIRGLKERRDLHAARCAAFGIYMVLMDIMQVRGSDEGVSITEVSDAGILDVRVLVPDSTNSENRTVEIASNKTPFTLIPIPLSKKRIRERGYNQCELIAQEIVKLSSVNMPIIEMKRHILKRSHSHAEQKTKGRADRISESKNFFAVASGADIAGSVCIVIDDVVTTGSTLVAAKRALLASGARQVIMIAVAH
ncbi:MAG: hypothetical protein RIT04_656 [Candidatus Parcubacteria bacterium]|jgi:ComF family protein